MLFGNVEFMDQRLGIAGLECKVVCVHLEGIWVNGG
jgi:hypothetical protein